MAIRGLLWLALLFAIAVVLAVVGRFDMGQVLLIYPPYRVDISLNLFVVGLVVLSINYYSMQSEGEGHPNTMTTPRPL